MSRDEIVEYPRTLVPSALVYRDLIEAIGRLGSDCEMERARTKPREPAARSDP
jgi:hypothetical protein